MPFHGQIQGRGGLVVLNRGVGWRGGYTVAGKRQPTDKQGDKRQILMGKLILRSTVLTDVRDPGY